MRGAAIGGNVSQSDPYPGDRIDVVTLFHLVPATREFDRYPDWFEYYDYARDDDGDYPDS